MTSNLKVKNYMQETSGAREGQSKRNWNTGVHKRICRENP